MAGEDDVALPALGDAWYDLAETEKPARRQPQLRARFWYEKASPGVTGLVRAKIDARLTDIPPLRAQAGAEAQPGPKAMANSIGMKLVKVPAGKFTMGLPATERGADRKADEGPLHEVEIARPFHLGMYEATQAEYEQIMGDNPSWFSSTGGGKGKVAGLGLPRGLPRPERAWQQRRLPGGMCSALQQALAKHKGLRQWFAASPCTGRLQIKWR